MSMDPKKEQARQHPIRERILALYEQKTDRSLAVDDLLRDLRADGGDGDHPGMSERAVHYHVLVLRDAGLLPA